jgi:UDP-glucose 4-epimerase
MHIFVTGGAGYIGSICSEELINAGHQVTIFDNLTEGHRAAVEPRATFIEGELANREQIISAVAAAKPDAIMHRNNVAAGVNLLDAAVEAGVKKFVFSSTCATYGTPEKIPMDERLPQKPINPYGHSKLIFEQILNWYDKIHGLVHVNLRYFNAAGASAVFGEDHRIETHLIPNVIKVALGQKDKCEIYGEKYATPDGTCIRDFIHIHDLAAAHMLALGRETSANYNLGSGEGFSVRQVIDIVRKVTGHPIPVVVKDPRPGDPPRLVARSHKITSELGWRPKYPRLQPIIESAWAWHQKHPNGYGD